MTGHDNGCSAACISVRKGHVRPRTMDDVSPGGLQGTHSFKIVAQQKLSAGHAEPQAEAPQCALVISLPLLLLSNRGHSPKRLCQHQHHQHHRTLGVAANLQPRLLPCLLP
ncbi:hypothetical protein HaLaN_28937 [Haematococcus lacustris]|uniref:Uncharacterized protein n=1 Tax=Haematococcus lacustris TaxID=44745 RepID=A0A6A0ACR1_HAELA|nr:hypothetical protein HaLaN_28937 [Haematococcus lacustris]